ncbi:MAG: tRNA uridine-5-carboxymethylaminomethyl(34) synthesis GTPase MnmE, partial [Flavobacteriales bacterium]|nr:tRNA uridine-5-carboxymethylaminomethyl(34) synthesis GTPase MnmE [Flavobacteriales bacterium]
DGVVFRFIDTAGIRHTDDTIEAIGVKKALEKVKSSAVVLYMFDVHEHSVGDLKNIMAKLLEDVQGTKAKVVWVGNKIDHEDFKAIAHEFEQFHNLVLVSAREKQNLDTLIDKLVAEINLDNTNLNQTIVTNTRHFEALSEANTALQKVKEGLELGISGDLLAMDIRQALNSLGSITGEVDVEELLGNIFGRFCIGK